MTNGRYRKMNKDGMETKEGGGTMKEERLRMGEGEKKDMKENKREN